MNHMNWAGNLRYGAQRVATPTSFEQIQELVSHADRVKALGSRHSFNRIADTDGLHISTSGMNQIEEIGEGYAVVQAGVRYGELAVALHRAGWALENMASLPHISVGGAVATATHGSGNRRQVLSAAVQAFDLVTAQGELVHVSPETFGDRFAGTVVHLGTLGVVARLWLKTIPTFSLRQDVFLDLSYPAARDHYEAISSIGESVSLFTNWREEPRFEIWVKGGHFEQVPADLYGATPAKTKLHVIGGLPPDPCTEQLGAVGPWHERLPHFRMEFTPSAGEELQTEYLVPRARLAEAMEAVYRFRSEISPLLFVSEIRSMAADDLWLSSAYGRDTVGIHFTWHPKMGEVLALLPKLESVLLPLGARPHWGKLFTAGRDSLREVYPRFEDFRKLRRELDPEGKFQNELSAIFA